MRRLIAVLTTAVTLAAATPASAATTLTAQFVTRHGSTLMLAGRPFRYVGVNYYYATDRQNMPDGGYDAGYSNGVMNRDLTELDGSLGNEDKVLRVWFFQRQATVNGRRDWAAFDQTLAVAAAHGYKVIATLTDQHDFTEGPNKDLSFYQSGYKTTVWPTSTTDYLDYVKQVVTRYRKNPTVLAWQLVNEGNASDADGKCPSESVAYRALYGFETTAMTTIRRIDPNHLISNGFQYGTCGLAAGTTDYASLADQPLNDLWELHDYTRNPISPDAAYLFAGAQAARRPVIVGEVGLPLSMGLQQRAKAFQAKFAAWKTDPAVAGITPWVFNGEPQLGTVDRFFDLDPGDPTLAALGKFGNKS